MATQLIADRIAVRRRYVRAVDIARDLGDPHALEGYVMTPSVRDGLRRLLMGLKPGSSQRAFRVTGPYGSGKSAFGLLLARLFCNEPRDALAQHLLQQSLGEQTVPAYLPIVLVGRRASLAQDLLVHVRDMARAEFGVDDELVVAAEKIGRGHGSIQTDIKSILDCLVACDKKLQVESGRGILLLIDEMGRYLEFAAANPTREDPSLFQQLAEVAGGAGNRSLAIVGFLHHRFSDYAATLGDWIEGEWARSSERYEEITFHETCEQSLHLLSQALTPLQAHTNPVRSAVRLLYRQAGQRGLFTLSTDDLLATAEQLYPLHPGSLACLFTSARRFGQNERSIYSFIQSSEPAGYQYFAHQMAYGPETWYRIDGLFDYLASQGSFRFQSKDRERRWQLAQDAVPICADMPAIVQRVLKTVSLIAVLEPVPGLTAHVDAIAWLLGCTERDVTDALAALVKRGVIHRRVAQRDWCLWSHTSVDLDHWFEEAKAGVPELRRLDANLATLPSIRPIVAQRHYHRTGTLRSFAVRISDKTSDTHGPTDGMVLVWPIYPDEDQANAEHDARCYSRRLGPLSLLRLQRISPGDLATAQELAYWKWVRTNCDELRIDDLARAEVERRIQHSRHELRYRLAPFTRANTCDRSVEWLYEGKRVAINSRATLSQFLSEVCDRVFTKAPVLRNELINRNKLSPAIAAARMRLLGLMLTAESRDYLGLAGAPPERTIYLSLFQASRIHRKENGVVRFAGPPTDDPMGWAPAWACIDNSIKGNESASVDKIIANLGEVPIGLRAGPALLLIAAYMLRHRTTIALFERGTFQPEVTPAHFMRLARSPKNFALHKTSVMDDDAILESLAKGLSIWQMRPPDAQLKPVISALYIWWSQLPEYARHTNTIDPMAQEVRTALRKATEPIDLLFNRLPQVCQAMSTDGIDVELYTSKLNLAVTQIANALPMVRRQAAIRLLNAFHAQSLTQLRQQIRMDYEDHLGEIASYELRAFVDRALNDELSDDTWLDGVAGLVVGKRLDSWDDTMLDHFALETRGIAQKLARRLALIAESLNSLAPVTAIHITTSDGSDQSLFVRDGTVKDRVLIDQARKLLDDAESPEGVLTALLAELMIVKKLEQVK